MNITYMKVGENGEQNPANTKQKGEKSALASPKNYINKEKPRKNQNGLRLFK